MNKDIVKLNIPDYAELTEAQCQLADMGDKTITTKISIDGQITPDFSDRWALEFKGEKYIMPLRLPQGSKENTKLDADFDLTFQHYAIYWLKQKYFFEYTSTASGTAIPDKWVVPLRLNLPQFCEYLDKVCRYWFGDKIRVDYNRAFGASTEDIKGVDISYSYIWDVLIKLYETYAVRWTIEPAANNDNTTEGGERYLIRIGYDAPELTHIFEYGFNGGLMKIERKVQDENIRNVMLGRGCDKNMPFRYFKNALADYPDMPADPDWIPELKDVYFSELRGKCFRDYVKGWKTNSHRQLTYKDEDGEDVTLTRDTYDAAYAATSYAYQRGATDTKFDPVEYVKDDASIAKYGELWGAKENNEEVYPSIQGRELTDIGRIDEVVAVEHIDDDTIIEEAAKEQAVISNAVVPGKKSLTIPAKQSKDFMLVGGSFIVPDDMTGNLSIGSVNVAAYRPISGNSANRSTRWEDHDLLLTSGVVSVTLENGGAAVGLAPGDYKWKAQVSVHNSSDDDVVAEVQIASANVVAADVSGSDNPNTFDIWIKNIWDSEQLQGESKVAYANRVWTPILGGRDGQEAKVVFASGMLSTSEDYEFTIVKGGVEFDDSQSIRVPMTDENGNRVNILVQSHWKLTLAKSDADLESTGLLIPSTMRQGKAGDKFFFTGIELPHLYVTLAEEEIDKAKEAELEKVRDIKPTWTVGLDKVRIANMQEGEVKPILQRLAIGASTKLRDKRLVVNEDNTQSAYETLYIQSVNYTYKSDTLIPDVDITLGTEYQIAANPVTALQGSVDAIRQQVGSLGNIEQMVRAVGDKLYLRKDGIEDISMSPTAFFSLLTSGNFRQGMVGGKGWGFYQDSNGRWVLETDRLAVREDMEVNNLVINQISARGGMMIESCAAMEITDVIEIDRGREFANNLRYVYRCFFDTKTGTVANLFRYADVAMCHRFVPNATSSSITDGSSLKFYKRTVVNTGENYVDLSKSEDITLGTGVPSTGDTIVQYGNYEDKTRQYVKVSDVLDGGYERYIEGLDGVEAQGVEYYFVGRQSGANNGRPRFFLGDDNGYIKWENGKLTIKGDFEVGNEVIDYIDNQIDAKTKGYRLVIENMVSGVACDASGNVTGFLPSSFVRVYKGATELMPDLFGIEVHGVGMTVAEDILPDTVPGKAAHYVWVSSLTSESATAYITAQIYDDADVELKGEMSVYKVMPGANGEDAYVYNLRVSPNVLKRKSSVGFDVDGNPITTTTLADSAVNISKYLTVGDECLITGDGLVSYRLFSPVAQPTGWTYLMDEGIPKGSITDIPANTTYIEIRYEVNGYMVDMQRIDVVADASEVTRINSAFLKVNAAEAQIQAQAKTIEGNTTKIGELDIKADNISLSVKKVRGSANLVNVKKDGWVHGGINTAAADNTYYTDMLVNSPLSSYAKHLTTADLIPVAGGRDYTWYIGGTGNYYQLMYAVITFYDEYKRYIKDADVITKVHCSKVNPYKFTIPTTASRRVGYIRINLYSQNAGFSVLRTSDILTNIRPMLNEGDAALDFTADGYGLAGSGIYIDSQQIVLDSEKTSITGNLFLGGGLFKVKKIINVAELSDYTYYDADLDEVEFDFMKAKSTWIELVGSTSASDTYFRLPITPTDANRQWVGTTMMLYNKTTASIPVAGIMHRLADGTFSGNSGMLGAKQCLSARCVVYPDSSGKESLGWLVEYNSYFMTIS